MFRLTIFPEGSLSESVITTVWVGVVVVSLFNLRLGWTFSGLVVPGYLVPIMIAKPLAAIVVCGEGLITYGIVYALSERLGGFQSRSWSSLFGRDRFLGLVIASVVVRILLDGWLLPFFGELVNQWLGIEFDYRNNLCSFGLIIVALIGNQFWKTGVIRGLIPFCTSIGLTYAIVRFGLMEYTNFSIGNLEFMYENISSSLLASPKAYVILITTAFLASRINLVYGWDFNGILIPSLLALQWYEPAKILTSFAEALLILGVGSLILRTPMMRSVTVEGSRKLLLFFNIAFTYKLIVAWLCVLFEWDVNVSDVFGFGYLVSTLIALKMHAMRSVLRFARATVQVSLMGVAAANIVGVVLGLAPELSAWAVPKVTEKLEPMETTESVDLLERLRGDKVRVYLREGRGEFAQPLPQELEIFERGCRHLRRFVASRSEEDLAEARAALERIGYGVEDVQGRFLYVSERRGRRGWGSYVLQLEAFTEAIISVPCPVDEWAVLEAGGLLFRDLRARWLAVGGATRRAGRGAGDVLINPRTLFSAFHREVGVGGVIQVRGYGEKTLAEVGLVEVGGSPGSGAPSGVASTSGGEPVATSASGLWVLGELPEGISYRRLRDLVGEFRIEFGQTPFRNLQREGSWGGFAELVLGRADRKRLLALAMVGAAESRSESSDVAETLELRELLPVLIEETARAGDESYRVPREEELLFFDEEILRPLLGMRKTAESVPGAGSPAWWKEVLPLLDRSARPIGYSVRYVPAEGDDGYVIVRESGEARRHWGTVVLRCGTHAPFIVQAPRPLLEKDTIGIAYELFEELRGSALIIAGAHPRTNADGSADVIREENRLSLFSCANQVLAREQADEPALTIQARAYGAQREATASIDTLVSFVEGRAKEAGLAVLRGRLLETLANRGLTVEAVEGQPYAAGYSGLGIVQARYLSRFPNKELAVVWVSPFARAEIGARRLSERDALIFQMVGVSQVEARILDVLGSCRAAPSGGVLADVPLDLVRAFLRTRDPVALDALVAKLSRRRAGSAHAIGELQQVVDRRFGMDLGVITLHGGGSAFVFKLGARDDGEVTTVSRWELGEDTLESFRSARNPFLFVGE